MQTPILSSVRVCRIIMQQASLPSNMLVCSPSSLSKSKLLCVIMFDMSFVCIETHL